MRNCPAVIADIHIREKEKETEWKSPWSVMNGKQLQIRKFLGEPACLHKLQGECADKQHRFYFV